MSSFTSLGNKQIKEFPIECSVAVLANTKEINQDSSLLKASFLKVWSTTVLNPFVRKNKCTICFLTTCSSFKHLYCIDTALIILLPMSSLSVFILPLSFLAYLLKIFSMICKKVCIWCKLYIHTLSNTLMKSHSFSWRIGSNSVYLYWMSIQSLFF